MAVYTPFSGRSLEGWLQFLSRSFLYSVKLPPMVFLYIPTLFKPTGSSLIRFDSPDCMQLLYSYFTS